MIVQWREWTVSGFAGGRHLYGVFGVGVRVDLDNLLLEVRVELSIVQILFYVRLIVGAGDELLDAVGRLVMEHELAVKARVLASRYYVA